MSKLKINKGKSNLAKTVSMSLAQDKPIVINDERDKGPGLVLLTGIEYNTKKEQCYVVGVDISKKDGYKKSISSIFSNSKISFASEKDAKILAKGIGKFTALASVNKKLSSTDKEKVCTSVNIDFLDGISESVRKEELTEAYEKVRDKIVKKFEKQHEKEQGTSLREFYDEDFEDEYDDFEDDYDHDY